MMFSNNSPVESRAFALPKIKFFQEEYVPVVVQTRQGLSPSSNQNENLVGAGVGPAKAAIGDEAPQSGWFNFLIFDGAKKNPEDDKKHPLRLLHLIDLSSSMACTASARVTLSRLQVAKNQIESMLKRIPEGIRENIEHVLIPYANDVISAKHFKNEASFIKALKKLGKYYGTNIYAPILKANQIARGLLDDGKRNLAILFSDGQHCPRKDAPRINKRLPAEDDAAEVCKGLVDTNTGLFTVGVSEEYRRPFLLNCLIKAGFGGLAHIPVNVGTIDIYRKVLPKFITDLATAPQFPIISFNSWFDHVVNINPTMRKVERDGGRFNAIAGYQNEAYSVAFVKEKDLDRAAIKKLVKDSASDKDVKETEGLQIEDINDIALDPSEKTDITKIAVDALRNIILNESTNTELALQLQQ